jgi:hypothetical protein
MNIQAIAGALGKHGVRVAKIVLAAEPEVEDDELEITAEVGVQVGGDYLIANRWSEAEEALYSGPSRARTPEGVALLAKDVGKMLAEGQAGQSHVVAEGG